MNDHVAEPFRSILNGFAGVKPSLQNQRVSNRSRYSILAGVQAELEAAGVDLDISQLDWAVRTVEQRLYEASLDRQYDEEQAKRDAAKQAEAEAEREELRQYREWRNDSGV